MSMYVDVIVNFLVAVFTHEDISVGIILVILWVYGRKLGNDSAKDNLSVEVTIAAGAEVLSAFLLLSLLYKYI